MQDIESHSNYRSRLIQEFVERQRRNPAYSLRSFARDLKLSPSVLSEVLNGKRDLSKTNLLKVTGILNFTSKETAEALDSIQGPSQADRDAQYSLLQDDIFRFMSDWFYFAILCLCQSGKVPSDAHWIAAKFNLSETDAADAMARLLRLKLISATDGKLLYDGRALRTTTDIPSAAVRALQHGHLKLAARALEETPVENRDITSITFAFARESTPEAKKMIRAFRRRFCRKFESKDPEHVHVLAVQFFPVTSE